MIKKMSEKFGKPANEFILRTDGRVEWLCEHGIGHTVYDPQEIDFSLHGCDGCCKKLKEIRDDAE